MVWSPGPVPFFAGSVQCVDAAPCASVAAAVAPPQLWAPPTAGAAAEEPPSWSPKVAELLPLMSAPDADRNAGAALSIPPSWTPTTGSGATAPTPTSMQPPPSWTPTFTAAAAAATAGQSCDALVIADTAPPGTGGVDASREGGDASLPSAGSSLHGAGKCSPCA